MNVSGNNMHINGNKVNSVIQWGGGFNINKGESVNFGGNSKNYLNIAHGTNKSTIAGVLNAKDNNVFLINPNGVIITKTGNINANRFVASTSSMSSDDMWKFANLSQEQAGSFSPVFKANKLGNVVNMGNINANDVLLIGNKVLLHASAGNDKGKLYLNQVNSKNTHLVGNEVYVDVANINKNNKLNITAKNKGSIYLSATGYYYNPEALNIFLKYSTPSYGGYKHNDKNFKKAHFVSIANTEDWWHFAKGWNENKNGFRTTANEYKLVSNINFAGKNYANYCIDGLGCSSMIVGNTKDNAFTKNFDGQGFVLKGMYIDTANLTNNDSKKHYVGIFGATKEASFTNINVDYSGGGINAKNEYVGGFAGYLDGFVDRASLKNLTSLKNDVKVVVDSGYITTYGTGGFAGDANGIFRNITLENIKNFDVKHSAIVDIPDEIDAYWKHYAYGVGGFAGSIFGFVDGISLKNVENLSIRESEIHKPIYGGAYISEYFIGLGGFAGYIANGNFSNISLNNIKNINFKATRSKPSYDEKYFWSFSEANIGGFAGRIDGGSFEDINLKTIHGLTHDKNDKENSIESSLGGFAGVITNGVFNKIALNDIKNLNMTLYGNYRAIAYLGGFAGSIDLGDFKNILLNDISGIKIQATVSSDTSWLTDKGILFGGFAGSIGQTYLSEINPPRFNNISLKNINNINLFHIEQSEYSYASMKIGGFAGNIEEGKYENIYLDNINGINANGRYGSIGGFAGNIYIKHNDTNLYKNIYLNNIGNITTSGNRFLIGGFSGGITIGEVGGKFENIIIKNIHDIKHNINGDEHFRSANIAGFVADFHRSYNHIYGKIEFNDIFIDGINNISIKNPTTQNSAIYGFAPSYYDSDRRFKFNKIHVYFHPNTTFTNNNVKIYKFSDKITDNMSNIHIYHHEKDFKDIMSNINTNNFTTHIYGDDNKDKTYQEFKSEYNLAKPDIKKPNITSPELPQNSNQSILPNLDLILNEKPTLNKDDLISNAVWNDYIIKDIDKIKYVINIRLLDKLLKEYKTLANKTEDEQVKFITAYLGVKENDARALLQSLSFLNTYKDHDINKAQFENTAKKDFEQSFKKADDKIKDFNKNKNLWHTKLDKLNKEVVSLGLDIEKQLEQNQAKLKRFIKAYNDFLTLIDKGIKNENDPAFIAIKNNIKELDKEAKLLYAKLSIQENNLQIFKDKNNNNKVIVIGKFNTSLINTPNVDKPTQGGGVENDDYQKLSRQIASSQKQTPTFKYEEEETQEIEEAAITQRARTCIVSDNFKTMNPCVVGSY
nr:filamentous hemagglutinin N-terminal domain-containing protein [Campylobacter peloridis]